MLNSVFRRYFWASCIYILASFCHDQHQLFRFLLLLRWFVGIYQIFHKRSWSSILARNWIFICTYYYNLCNFRKYCCQCLLFITSLWFKIVSCKSCNWDRCCTRYHGWLVFHTPTYFIWIHNIAYYPSYNYLENIWSVLWLIRYIFMVTMCISLCSCVKPTHHS